METPTEKNDKFDPLEEYIRPAHTRVFVDGSMPPVDFKDFIDFMVSPSNPEEIEKIVEHNAEPIGRRVQQYREEQMALEDVSRRLTGERGSSSAPSLPPGVFEMPDGSLIYKDGSPVIVLDSWVFPEEKPAPKIVVSDDPGVLLTKTIEEFEATKTTLYERREIASLQHMEALTRMRYAKRKEKRNVKKQMMKKFNRKKK